VKLSDEGVPPLAFVQLLERRALDPDAAARLRAIMHRGGTSEATLIQHDVQAPIRWFREVYPDSISPKPLDSDLRLPSRPS
jgi:hypothetical protein